MTWRVNFVHAGLLHCLYISATTQIQVCCYSFKQGLILRLVIYDTVSTSLAINDFSKSTKLRGIIYNWKLKTRVVGLNASLISLDVWWVSSHLKDLSTRGVKSQGEKCDIICAVIGWLRDILFSSSGDSINTTEGEQSSLLPSLTHRNTGT